MKKFRWQLIIILLTGLVVGVLLLSEQPDGSSSSSTPEPVRGGVYTEALIGSLQRLNPVLDYYNSADRDVNRLVFSSLVRFDSRGLPQPDLAESWGISQDGTIYNITLRKNAVWHDGQPVTSDDVVFTIDLLRNGGSVVPEDIQTFWKDIEVKALSTNVLQIKLPEAYAPFLDSLNFGVLPKHLLGEMTIDQIIDAPFGLQPVGSGPYKFDRLITENGAITGVSLTSFADYYGTKPFIEQVVFRYYPDGPSAYQAYKDGLVQGISQVKSDTLAAVLSDSNLSVYSGRLPQLSMLMLNLNNPEAEGLKDAEVRKALYEALNRQWMIDHILLGQAVQANGVIFPGTWAYYSSLSPVAFDKDAAVEDLKTAGYALAADNEAVRKKGETALSFQLIYPDDDTHRVLAEAIQNDWADIQVEVTLEAVPYDMLISDRLEQRNFQIALVDLNMARTPDPDPYPFWDQGQATGGQNYSQWNHRMASEYLEQARITVDLTERTHQYKNFQILFNQELPSLPLFYPIYTYAVDRQVQGVRMGPLYDPSDRFANEQEWFLAVAKKGAKPATTPPAK
jgi:peptide/nickel transport system substrate-binding protein